MALDTRALGRTFEPHTYAVGREKIREFARAVGEKLVVLLFAGLGWCLGH